MDDSVPVTTLRVVLPEEIIRNLKAELTREGKNPTQFIKEQATKYLASKRVRLSGKARGGRRAS